MNVGDFEAGKIDIPGWLSRHGTDAVDSIVELVVKHMREELGVKKIAAAGYCFGGKVWKLPTQGTEVNKF